MFDNKNKGYLQNGKARYDIRSFVESGFDERHGVLKRNYSLIISHSTFSTQNNRNLQALTRLMMT